MVQAELLAFASKLNRARMVLTIRKSLAYPLGFYKRLRT